MFWSCWAAVTLIVLSALRKFHPRSAAPQMMNGEPTDASGWTVAVDAELAEYWLTPMTPENAPCWTSAPPTWTPDAWVSSAPVAPEHVSMLPFPSTAGLAVLSTRTQLAADDASFCESSDWTVLQIVVGSPLEPVATAYW